MARRGRKSGGGQENMLAIIAGSVAAVIGDFAWNSMRLPGFDKPSSLPMLSQGDIIQMGGGTALTALGFSQGCSRIAPFGFGALAAQVLSKVIFPSFDLPRYLVFDIDKSGRLTPEFQFPDIDIPGLS